MTTKTQAEFGSFLRLTNSAFLFAKKMNTLLVNRIALFSWILTVPGLSMPEYPVANPFPCSDKGVDCTASPSSCCHAHKCVGWPRSMKCAEPPICLPEWYDCSDQGTPCCEGFVCSKDPESTETVPQCRTSKDVIHLLSFPINERKLTGGYVNYNTTKIPGEPVTTNIACSTGDPHSKFSISTLKGPILMLTLTSVPQCSLDF